VPAAAGNLDHHAVTLEQKVDPCNVPAGSSLHRLAFRNGQSTCSQQPKEPPFEKALATGQHERSGQPANAPATLTAHRRNRVDKMVEGRHSVPDRRVDRSLQQPQRAPCVGEIDDRSRWRRHGQAIHGVTVGRLQ
jgi:hypothetical protein